jgi:hypothetical protein
LPSADPTSVDVDECLLQVLSLAGKPDRAADMGRTLLARLGHDPRWARRRAEVELRLARAAIAATRWDEAHEILEQARLEIAAAPEEYLARLDAVRAQTAMMRNPEKAPALARAALEAAERLGHPDVACEALEVLGRSQRIRDLPAAEDAFAHALAVAEASGLTVWRARVLHELGAIDMFQGRPLARLEEARELALSLGALATAAVVHVQLAAGLVPGDDPDSGAIAARRSAELARRYRLDQTLAGGVGGVRARSPQAAHADAAMHRRGACPWARHTRNRGEDFHGGRLPGGGRGGQGKARHHLCAGLRAISVPERTTRRNRPSGLLALLRQLDGPAEEAAEIEIPEKSVHFMASAYLRYAAGVATGRRGNGDLAAAFIAEGDRTLGDHRWLRHLGRQLVAEAAVEDGWGDPVRWLREALTFFDGRGDDQILRRAGPFCERPEPLSRAAGTTGVCRMNCGRSV